MNPLINPYSPGAGTPPPELAGRDDLIERAAIALQRIASGRFGKSLILTGLRGVGKTVLLNRIRLEAEANNLIAIRLEAVEGRSLPSLLVPGFQSAILKLDKGRAATELAKRGLVALTHFIRSMKLKFGDIEWSMDLESEKNILPSTLDGSLYELFQSLGSLARERKTAIVLFIDELHVLDPAQLASLIVAFHLAAQDSLPITMVAAGLPQIPAKMGEAKTYAERLFEFPHIGQLNTNAAQQALVIPAEKLNVKFTNDALAIILQQTEGYAYFIQEWGKHVWDIANTSLITKSNAVDATVLALADLDASFFRVRYDQLKPMQKKYLRAMAELGTSTQGSGQVAKILNKKVTDLAAVRDQLINKGLVYSPSYGEIAFTVPLFGAFMKRMMKHIE